MPRTIAIGDIHGCADEFEALLAALRLRSGDRIVQVGDLVNRGPDSHRVLELARQYRIESILGNHELRLLTARRENRPQLLKDYDKVTVARLTEADWDYLESLPKLIYDEPLNTIFVHGGFLPGQPWASQPVDVVTSVQVVTRGGKGAKRSDAPKAPAWAETWQGLPHVIYGHTPRPEVFCRPGSVGIDTGCVYGGHLTAYIIETGKFVQIPARRAYAHSKNFPGPNTGSE